MHGTTEKLIRHQLEVFIKEARRRNVDRAEGAFNEVFDLMEAEIAALLPEKPAPAKKAKRKTKKLSEPVQERPETDEEVSDASE